MRRRRRRALLAILGLVLIATVCADRRVRAEVLFVDPGFTSEVVAELSPFAPVGLTFAPDGRIFVWEKSGVVRIVKRGKLLSVPFLDISRRVNRYWDRGLLGFALHPNFRQNGYAYLLYTREDGGEPEDSGPKTARLTRISASSGNPDVASPQSEVVLIDDIPAEDASHTIGTVRFAPDKTLFFGTGDAASFTFVDANALRAQDLDSLPGKVFRVRPSDGAGLPDNPFYNGDPFSVRSRVWAYGLRNPFRFAFDATGELYIGDVGWDTWEEINRGRGKNFGWPCFEGGAGGNAQQPDYRRVFAACRQLRASAVTAPIYSYDHGVGSAVVGGAFYKGTAYPESYRGSFFFGDFGARWIRRLVFDGDGKVASVEPFAEGVGNDLGGPVALELGPDGLLYYVEIMTGQIRRIRYGSTLVAAASASPSSGASPLMVAFSSEGTSGLPGSRLTYRWDFGDGATSRQANPVHRYRSGRARTFTAKLTVTAADGPDRGQRDTATVSVTVGSTPPVPTILAPVEGMAVGVGQTVVYEGSATDAEEGPLGSEALRWTVLLHHNEHVHTVAETTGERGQFVVEDHGAGRFGYEVVLTARDESGLEASTSAQVRVGGVSVAPSSVSFGSIVVRQRSSDETVTVRNAGSERLRLQTLKLDGADVNQFRKSADGCSGKTLGPGQACTVKVRFQPTTVGEQRAELLVPTDDPNAEPVSIPLDGTGVSARLAVTDR